MPRPKSNGLPLAEQERLRNHLLLEVAAEVFLEQGYEAASTNEIAKRANASKQTFYTRFQTKEQLFLAVIDYRTSKVADSISLIFDKSEPLRVVLIETAHTLLSTILSREHLALLRIVYMEAPHFPDAAKLLIERGPDQGTTKLAEYLSLQVKRGLIHTEDTKLAAQHFSSLVVGDLVHRALLGLGSPSQRNHRTRIRTSVDAFLKIYAPV